MTTAFITIFISFAVTALLGPFVIPWLKRLKFGQTEREEGVKEHLKKAGTPTMGGIMILAGIIVGSIVAAIFQPKMAVSLILVLGFGAIGFIDDYLKVVKKRSDGLYPKQKLALQFVVATVFLIVMVNCTDTSMLIRVPFTGGFYLDLSWFSYIFFYLVVLAVVNGVNFTDGLDGLASNVTSVVAVFCIFASMALGTQIEAGAGAVLGSLLAFLLFNTYPAKIFMGDTGSLALGGFVAAYAYLMNMPLYILLFGIIYACELLSVVIQVSYFKATHGKRIFKMTPIHHHFELCGWSESRIVAVFTIITLLMSIIAYAAI